MFTCLGCKADLAATSVDLSIFIPSSKFCKSNPPKKTSHLPLRCKHFHTHIQQHPKQCSEKQWLHQAVEGRFRCCSEVLSLSPAQQLLHVTTMIRQLARSFMCPAAPCHILQPHHKLRHRQVHDLHQVPFNNWKTARSGLAFACSLCSPTFSWCTRMHGIAMVGTLHQALTVNVEGCKSLSSLHARFKKYFITSLRLPACQGLRLCL